jgi:hypothetical protein
LPDLGQKVTLPGMRLRASLLFALLGSSSWAQGTFDLKSDSIQKIVRQTAGTQFSPVQEARSTPVATEPAPITYVPPEKPPAPAREAPRKLPDPVPPPEDFFSSLVSMLVDELLGIDEADEITARNDMLRCRVQKEIKSAPPGIDNCPIAD